MIWNPVNNIVLVSKMLGDFPMWVLRLIVSIQLFCCFLNVTGQTKFLHT